MANKKISMQTVYFEGERLARIQGYLSCKLCNNLLKEATATTQCTDTFCRLCIFEKLIFEKMKCCPICNIDLGEYPLYELRSDTALQDIRNKIFPPAIERKWKVPEINPSAP